MRERGHHSMSMTGEMNECAGRGGTRNEASSGGVCASQTSKHGGHGGREEGGAIVGDVEEKERYSDLPDSGRWFQ